MVSYKIKQHVNNYTLLSKQVFVSPNVPFILGQARPFTFDSPTFGGQIWENKFKPGQKKNVCGFWPGDAIGPYFFENDNSEAIRTMITNFFRVNLNEALHSVFHKAHVVWTMWR